MEKEQIKKNISLELEKLNNKDFTIYFYVIDSMGNPHSSLEHMYNQAKTLKDYGFKVVMLHEEEEYYGVSDWMGSEFMELPHKCVTNKEFSVYASDIIVIPEVLANIMIQIKNTPCKKVVFCEKYDRLFEYLPIGKSWVDLGITDVITTNQDMRKDLVKLFPQYQNINVINPPISDKFKVNTEEKDLTVAIFSENKSKAMRFIKEFVIKYPLYRWVTFKDIRSMTNDSISTALNKSAISVVLDDRNDYLLTNAIKSIKSNCITLCQTETKVPEWGVDGDKINDSAIFTTTIEETLMILKGVIEAFCTDKVPVDIYSDMTKVQEKYSLDIFNKDVINTYSSIVDERVKAFEKIINE